jgi:hypothetical protein
LVPGHEGRVQSLRALWNAIQSAIKSRSTSKSNKDDVVEIYRAVGPNEYADIVATNRFRASGRGSLDAKQFGISLIETKLFSSSAFNRAKDMHVVAAKIRRSDLNRLADFTRVDEFMFKGGTVTIQPENLDDFNSSLLGIRDAD